MSKSTITAVRQYINCIMLLIHGNYIYLKWALVTSLYHFKNIHQNNTLIRKRENKPYLLVIDQKKEGLDSS